jgi:hypothetical protein
MLSLLPTNHSRETDKTVRYKLLQLYHHAWTVKIVGNLLRSKSTYKSKNLFHIQQTLTVRIFIDTSVEQDSQQVIRTTNKSARYKKDQ